MHPQPTIRRLKRRRPRIEHILGLTAVVLVLASFGPLELLNDVWPDIRVLGMRPGNLAETAAIVGLVLIMWSGGFTRLVKRIRHQSPADITHLNAQRRH